MGTQGESVSLPEPSEFLVNKGHVGMGLAMGRRQFIDLLKEYSKMAVEEAIKDYEREFRLKRKYIDDHKGFEE